MLEKYKNDEKNLNYIPNNSNYDMFIDPSSPINNIFAPSFYFDLQHQFGIQNPFDFEFCQFNNSEDEIYFLGRSYNHGITNSNGINTVRQEINCHLSVFNMEWIFKPSFQRGLNLQFISNNLGTEQYYQYLPKDCFKLAYLPYCNSLIIFSKFLAFSYSQTQNFVMKFVSEEILFQNNYEYLQQQTSAIEVIQIFSQESQQFQTLTEQGFENACITVIDGENILLFFNSKIYKLNFITNQERQITKVWLINLNLQVPKFIDSIVSFKYENPQIEEDILIFQNSSPEFLIQFIQPNNAEDAKLKMAPYQFEFIFNRDNRQIIQIAQHDGQCDFYAILASKAYKNEKINWPNQMYLYQQMVTIKVESDKTNIFKQTQTPQNIFLFTMKYLQFNSLGVNLQNFNNIMLISLQNKTSFFIIKNKEISNQNTLPFQFADPLIIPESQRPPLLFFDDDETLLIETIKLRSGKSQMLTQFVVQIGKSKIRFIDQKQLQKKDIFFKDPICQCNLMNDYFIIGNNVQQNIVVYQQLILLPNSDINQQFKIEIEQSVLNELLDTNKIQFQIYSIIQDQDNINNIEINGFQKYYINLITKNTLFHIYEIQFNEREQIQTQIKKNFQAFYINQGLPYIINDIKDEQNSFRLLTSPITDPTVEMKLPQQSTYSSIAQMECQYLNSSYIIIIRLNAGDIFVYKGIKDLQIKDQFPYNFIRIPIPFKIYLPKNIRLVTNKEAQNGFSKQNSVSVIEMDILDDSDYFSSKTNEPSNKLIFPSDLSLQNENDTPVINIFPPGSNPFFIFEKQGEIYFHNLRYQGADGKRLLNYDTISLAQIKYKDSKNLFIAIHNNDFCTFQYEILPKSNLGSSPIIVPVTPFNIDHPKQYPQFIETVKTIQKNQINKYLIILYSIHQGFDNSNNSSKYKYELIVATHSQNFSNTQDPMYPLDIKSKYSLEQGNKIYQMKVFEISSNIFQIYLLSRNQQNTSDFTKISIFKFDDHFQEVQEWLFEIGKDFTFQDFVPDICFLKSQISGDGGPNLIISEGEQLNIHRIESQGIQSENKPAQRICNRTLINNIYNLGQLILVSDYNQGFEILKYKKKGSSIDAETNLDIIADINSNFQIRNCMFLQSIDSSRPFIIVSDEEKNIEIFNINPEQKLIDQIADYNFGSLTSSMKIYQEEQQLVQQEDTQSKPIQMILISSLDSSIKLMKPIYNQQVLEFLKQLHNMIFKYFPFTAGVNPLEIQHASYEIVDFQIKYQKNLYNSQILDIFLNMTITLQRNIAQQLETTQQQIIEFLQLLK